MEEYAMCETFVLLTIFYTDGWSGRNRNITKDFPSVAICEKAAKKIVKELPGFPEWECTDYSKDANNG